MFDAFLVSRANSPSLALRASQAAAPRTRIWPVSSVTHVTPSSLRRRPDSPRARILREVRLPVNSDMRKLRDLLTLLILCSLVGLSVAATVQAIRTGLPTPAENRHEELRRSLTTGRVNELPIEYQRVLLRQLEGELRSGVDWQQELAATPPRKRRLTTDNLADLASLWLNERMDEYFSIPDQHDRDEYLDQEIERIIRWKTVQSMRHSAANGADPQERELALDMAQRILSDAFKSNAPTAFRTTLRTSVFWHAVQERWKEIAARNAFPTGPPADE